MNTQRRISKLAVLTTLAGFLLIAGNNVFAQHRSGFGGMHKGRHGGHGLQHIERYSEELGLTDEQVSSIKKNWFETRKETIGLKSDIKISKVELRELMMSDNPDESKVRQQVEKIGKQKTDLMMTHTLSMLKFKNILTPEQLDKLKELKRENMQKRRGMRGFRRGFGRAHPGGFDDSFGVLEDEEDLVE